MFNQKRPADFRINNASGATLLIMLLVIIPAGIGYITTTTFGLPAWTGIIIGLVSSMIVLSSLVFLLAACFNFADHLPGSENDDEKDRAPRITRLTGSQPFLPDFSTTKGPTSNRTR